MVVALAAVLMGVTAGRAHEPVKRTEREIVWLKGYRRSGGSPPAGSLVLRAQGADHPFAADVRQALAVVEAGKGPPSVPDRLTLEGPRELVARFTAAPPSDRIILLGERSPGSARVFVLDVEVCPAR